MKCFCYAHFTQWMILWSRGCI